MAKRVFKPRKMRDRAWWDEQTAPFFAWMSGAGLVTWPEIRAWGRAHEFTNINMLDLVAYLDNVGRIENKSTEETEPRWGVVVAEQAVA